MLVRYSSLSYATLGQQGTVATRARVPRTAWSSQIYLTDLYLDVGSLADGGRFRHLRCLCLDVVRGRACRPPKANEGQRCQKNGVRLCGRRFTTAASESSPRSSGLMGVVGRYPRSLADLSG